MKFHSKKYLSVGVMVVASALVGCGGGTLPTYPARGKVVFADGTPLSGGTVEFHSVQSEKPITARGQVQSDGSFQLSTFCPNDGAVEGEHLVLICPAPPKRMGLASDPKLAFDVRFARYDTSGLKCTVTSDPTRNQFTLHVERTRK